MDGHGREVERPSPPGNVPSLTWRFRCVWGTHLTFPSNNSPKNQPILSRLFVWNSRNVFITPHVIEAGVSLNPDIVLQYLGSLKLIVFNYEALRQEV